MPDTFAITVGFIALTVVLGAFFRGRSRDKCLKDFERYPVTLRLVGGKAIYGRLGVETTGLELTYAEGRVDEDGHYEKSYILYKAEFKNIRRIDRFHDELNEAEKKKRERELKRTYRPSAWRRLQRRVRNFFNTVRDSIMEVVNVLIGRMKTTQTGGRVLQSQDKHVAKIQKEILGGATVAYEPLMERHIGKKVVVDFMRDDEAHELAGVLKEYTTDFISIMDVDFKDDDLGEPRKADMLIPRQWGIVRHGGE